MYSTQLCVHCEYNSFQTSTTNQIRPLLAPHHQNTNMPRMQNGGGGHEQHFVQNHDPYIQHVPQDNNKYHNTSQYPLQPPTQQTSPDPAAKKVCDAANYQLATRVDKISAVLFPFVFAVFNICYW
jgi:hypothetical protein